MMTTARNEYSSQRSYSTLTSRQIEVLALLAQQDHWSVGEVAAALSVSSAAATKAIARLEKKGLVTRSADMLDRRCVNVRVTRAGNEAIRQSERKRLGR
jgi:DNA-binding MarR family transcriptional regulator